jgi:glycosyltransferase involved in cell wall biosynthesis
MSATNVSHDVERIASSGLEPMRARSVSVVIPVHNEEEILRETVDQVATGLRRLPLDWFEVILCENGSSDRTHEIARELRRDYPEVRVLWLPMPDYGAAMKAGFFAAEGEVVVNFDADYYDMDFLASALRVEGDIVVAAKSIVGSHDSRVVTRRIVSRGFGAFVRSLLSLRVTETHGMKLFHASAIAHLIGAVESTKDLFDTELLARAEWSGLRIRELPIHTEELRHSRSGIVRRIPRTMWGLVKMRVRLRREHATRVRVLPEVPATDSLVA